MADILPECLVHKILSNLSFEAAAKSSMLSKTWLQAWFTCPNLKFKVEYGKGNNNRKIVDKVMERYRERNIPIEKFALSILTSHYHRPLVIPWMDKWLGIALQNGVKDVVCEISVPSYPFPISTFLASRTLRELVLTGCELSLSTSQVAKCHSLRKLSLTNVRLDDNLLQTLLNCCPLIVNFIIAHCPLLTKIELRNLQNIKSVSISTSYNLHIIQSVKIQAPTLEHLSYSGCRPWGEPPVLDIIKCQNLKSLELYHINISEEFLQPLISTSQYLESLILDDVGSLEKFNICESQSLKVLGILHCEDIGEIDASNLVSLEYVGSTIPEFKRAKESRQLKNSRSFLYCSSDFNVAWFCKLRKFLSNLTSWSHVSLHFDKWNEINMKDLQLHHSVSTPQLDILNVRLFKDKWSSQECPSFVDALLWSCHPRRLNLFATVEMITFFLNRLMYMMNSSYSTSHGRKPWHSQLNEVRAYKFGSAVELKSEELATLTEMDAIYFLLDW